MNKFIFFVVVVVIFNVAFAYNGRLRQKAPNPPYGSYESSDDDAASEKSKDFTPTFHIGNGIDMLSTLKFTYSKPRITVKSVFPQLQGEQENIELLNQIVTNLVLQEIAQFQNQVTQTVPDPSALGKNAKNDLYIDYAASVIRFKSNHILSFRFVIQGYVAGIKQPFQYHRVLNYNLENGEQIALSDLFKPDSTYLLVLSHYTREILLKRLPESGTIMIGTAPREENFRNWNFKSNGLFITFENSQVAPSVYGAQSVLIPYSELKTIAMPDSPLAYCIKRPKACGQNNLLTGGFIDEVVNTRHRRLNPILSKR